MIDSATSIGLAAMFAGLLSAQQETMTDYPENALREGREGMTHVAGIVGADGRAKSCEIDQSSGSADLDAATCDIMMKRARWKPARDAQGQPTEGRYQLKFNWKIPR